MHIHTCVTRSHKVPHEVTQGHGIWPLKSKVLPPKPKIWDQNARFGCPNKDVRLISLMVDAKSKIWRANLRFW